MTSDVYTASDDNDVCPRCGDTTCDCPPEQVQSVVRRSLELDAGTPLQVGTRVRLSDGVAYEGTVSYCHLIPHSNGQAHWLYSVTRDGDGVTFRLRRESLTLLPISHVEESIASALDLAQQLVPLLRTIRQAQRAPGPEQAWSYMADHDAQRLYPALAEVAALATDVLERDDA